MYVLVGKSQLNQPCMHMLLHPHTPPTHLPGSLRASHDSRPVSLPTVSRQQGLQPQGLVRHNHLPWCASPVTCFVPNTASAAPRRRTFRDPNTFATIVHARVHVTQAWPPLALLTRRCLRT